MRQNKRFSCVFLLKRRNELSLSASIITGPLYFKNLLGRFGVETISGIGTGIGVIMLKAFNKKLRLVRLRCSINLLLKFAGMVLLAAGIAAAMAVLAERLFAVSIITNAAIWGFGAIGTIAILLLWVTKQPSRMQASILLDERLRLNERFSTALAFSGSDDPFAAAACAEAHKRAENIKLDKHFPIRPSKCWAYATSTWVMVLALVFFLPQKDLLGFMRGRQEKDKQVKQIEKAVADVNQATASVKLAVKRLDPELAEALKKLDQTPKGADPQEIKRVAIRKLGDLAEQIQKMHAGKQLDSMNMMQEMFKQLKGSSDIFSQKLRQALAQGKYGEASNLMNQLLQQLADGKLSNKQREDMARQLQELGKQLKELAANQAQLEKELEKMGLSKDLAKMDLSQLQKELEKMGLDEKKIAELMKQASASQAASMNCLGLGQAMMACGGGGGGNMSAGDMGGLMDQLDSFEVMSQQIMMAQATLAEISRTIGGLGQGMGQGLGQGFGQGFGQGGGIGPGIGTSGTGYGPPGEDPGWKASEKIRVQNKTGGGPIIASWYFNDAQVKGEAKRDFTQVIQAARDGAAEAINENEIPRKYEDAVKTYFSQVEKSGPQSQ